MQKRGFYSYLVPFTLSAIKLTASSTLTTIKFLLSLIARISAYVDVTDIFVLSGISMIFYGTYVVYPPVSYIITGGLLIWVGMRGINSNPD